MKQKFKKLSGWSFALAMAIFLFSYVLFHYVTPEGTLTMVYSQEPGKPLLTELWANLGVLFLFSSITCRMIAGIFFPEKQ